MNIETMQDGGKKKSNDIVKLKREPTDTKVSKNEEKINDLSLDDIFKFMDLYFNRYGILYSHLYNSYNKFLDEDVKNFLETGDHTFYEKITKDKVIKYKFKYENVSIKEPTLENESEPMFPSDARNRNLTYSARILAKVTQIQEVTDIVTDEKKEKVIGQIEDNVPLASIPVMVRSKFCSLNIHKGYDKSECEYDPGGYFIVNGSEKVIISQDRMCDNKPLVFLKKDGGMEFFTAQVNSRSYKPHGITQILSLKLKKDSDILIRVPILNEVSVYVLFRALGIETDKDIINYIVYDENDYEMIDKVRNGLEFCKNDKGQKIRKQQDAIDFLVGKLRVLKKYTDNDPDIKIKQRRLHLTSLLENNFLPHMEGQGLMEKAYYLGHVIHKLLNVALGRVQTDDRDSYVNKRVDLAGDLIMELFKQYYRKMMNDCNKFFKKRNTSDEEPLNIINQIKPNTIEQGIKGSLSTGAWPRRKGVAQVLQRITYVQTICFLRRIDAPGGDASSSKLTGPRQLHPSSVGLLCPVSTPEHAKVGLTKHLGLISSISVMQTGQTSIVKTYLKRKVMNVGDVPSKKIKDMTKVFLNGEWLGVTNEPFKLEEEVREKKLKGIFDQFMSIINDISEKEIRIYTDSGRVYKPVMRVEENKLLLTKDDIKTISLNKSDKDKKITSWEEFIIKNPDKVEYIDMEESPFTYIANNIETLENERNKMKESISKVKNIKVEKKYEDALTESYMYRANVQNRYDEYLFNKYSHCEFHPSFLLSEISTNVPFCNHNAGARNIFNYAQSRQAMGIYISNYRDRLDISYILFHPQKPLLATRTSKYNYTDVMASGENVVVAIALYSGLTI